MARVLSAEQLATLAEVVRHASAPDGGPAGGCYRLEIALHANVEWLAEDRYPEGAAVASLGWWDDEDEVERTFVVVVGPDGKEVDSYESN